MVGFRAPHTTGNVAAAFDTRARRQTRSTALGSRKHYIQLYITPVKHNLPDATFRRGPMRPEIGLKR